MLDPAKVQIMEQASGRARRLVAVLRAAESDLAAPLSRLTAEQRDAGLHVINTARVAAHDLSNECSKWMQSEGGAT